MATELDEELSYIRGALGRKKAEVSSARLATALIRSFKLGYNGNHSTYGSGMMLLHRARLAHESAAYDKVSELWYPPKEHTKHNRANLPGETIFYCASGNATSILELRPNVGDVISMMTCTLSKDPLKVKLIYPTEFFVEYGLAEQYIPFETLCYEVFRRTCYTPFDYIISGGLGSLFFQFTDIDGLVYPSIASELKGVNVALRAAVADKYLTPLSFRAYRVIELRSPFDMIVQCVATAPPSKKGDNINWAEVSCGGHHITEHVFERPCSE